MKTKCLSYEYWVDRIESGEPFTFTRYGDGEYKAIVGKKTRNCDGHTLANGQMRRELVKSIVRPRSERFIRGIWMDKKCRPVKAFGQNYQAWANKHAGHVTWYDGLIFNFANNEGRNYPFFEVMRNHKLPIVVIGPKHLRRLKEKCFDYDGFVQVPYRTAYQAKARIIQEALEFEPPVLYSISAGPPAPIFAHELWKARGDSCMILDLGSIFDGYCGKKTRRAWREFITPEIARRNLEGP